MRILIATCAILLATACSSNGDTPQPRNAQGGSSGAGRNGGGNTVNTVVTEFALLESGDLVVPVLAKIAP